MRRKFALFLVLITALYTRGLAQDTLRVTMQQADSLFLNRNFVLLSARFGVDAARGQEIQARLYDNPSLFAEQSVYNNRSGRYFPTATEYGDGSQGENIFQLQQLFYLAGKRNKRINIALTQTRIAGYQFYDLIRTLKYQLHTNFHDLYYGQLTLALYKEQIANIQRTVSLYDPQVAKGNVSLKEAVRLKALLFQLQNEQKNLQNAMAEEQSQLLILLGDTQAVALVPVMPLLTKPIPPLNTVGSYSGIAMQNRQDLLAADANRSLAAQNLALERANAVPDLKLGASYDRNGSYIQNYVGVNAAIDLPVFNRNQGNIKTAKALTGQADLSYNNYRNVVEKEVLQAYIKTRDISQLYNTRDASFNPELEKLISGVLASYQKNNITLLEFLDFFEAYKEAVIQRNNLQRDLFQAFDELNYATGTETIKY